MATLRSSSPSLEPNLAGKSLALAGLAASQVAVLSVWFSTAAILPDLSRSGALSPAWQAAFTSAVQLGFAIGAIGSAIIGLADRGDPRRLFMTTAIIAAIANAGLLVVPPGSPWAIVLRLVVGMALAGVYPVGMKIALGWGQKDRGFLVGLLVGALTLGAASPHLAAALGGADWRSTIVVTSLAAFVGAILIRAVALGPFHAASGRFRFSVVKLAWKDRRIRLTNLGYLGHMWELYALWAWVGIALTASLSWQWDEEQAALGGRLGAFAVIGIGSVGCLFGGWAADRIGKIEVATISMVISGSCAVAVALGFGGPVWMVMSIALVWGFFVIADSAQFSATIADFSLPNEVGTLLSFQTGMGFMLTVFTVQGLPVAVNLWGWPAALALLALGPVIGSAAMIRLKMII